MTFIVTEYKALKVFVVQTYFHEEFDSLKSGSLYKQKGGHAMEFKGKNFKVGIDKLTSYRFVLLQTADYDTLNKKNSIMEKKSSCRNYFSTRSLSALVCLSFIVKILSTEIPIFYVLFIA